MSGIRRILVTLLDAAAIAAGSAALVILLGGGTRLAFAGMRISLRGVVNALVVCVALAALRLLIARGERLLPALPRQAGGAVREERSRFASTAVRPAGFWLYAAAAALASLVWLMPHVLHPRRVPDRGDPVFSAWRLAAFAHQLAADPRRLFDGNIFYPETRTLTYSDATVLQAMAAAPVLLLGADPLLVGNLLFLIAFPLNALAFFYLAWRLTADLRCGFVAGVFGALYPFHGEHYSHLELQYTFFIPLAIVALLDLLVSPAVRRGVALGAIVAAQWFASMYLGLMLLTFLAPFGAIVAAGWGVGPSRRLAAALAPAAAIVALSFALLGLPYMQSPAARGDRSLALAGAFSAQPAEYGRPQGRLAAYQWISRRGNRSEREMFPGLAILGAAAIGAVPAGGAVGAAALVGGALAFDWSLGPYGLTYDDLYRWVMPYRGLRVPARFSVFVGTALVVLAALGTRRLFAAAARVRLGTPAFAAVAALALVDLRLDVRVVDFWTDPPDIYRSVTPSMVLAEFPWDRSPDYMYFSTRHWARLLNGYSGSFTERWISLQTRVEPFPAPEAIAAARAAGATHLTFNCALEPRQYRCAPTFEALDANPSLELVASSRWEGAHVRLYRFR
ncbi:MAG TPA: hypothetical protein VFK57_18370 [Vicinamibacterales bacterium]|nr:hypothetical protein [Vicinamibacterales bacterium]